MDQARRLREFMGAIGGNAPPRARIIAVTSGKGGVGKTNLAVSLALGAAEAGRDVILLDGDLGLANVDVLLDIQAPFNLSHIIAGEISVEESLVEVPGGVRLLPGAAGLASIADLSAPEHQLFLKSLERLEEQTEIIIIDTGAGISRRVIDFCIASGEVLIVTTPEPTAIADAYAMIKVLAQAQPTLKLWLVVNIAGSRSEADQIAERITVLSERFLGVEVRRAGYVLADPRVPFAVRRRVPFSQAYPSTQAAQCVREVALRLGLEDRAHAGGSGFFRRMSALWRSRTPVSTGESN